MCLLSYDLGRQRAEKKTLSGEKTMQIQVNFPRLYNQMRNLISEHLRILCCFHLPVLFLKINRSRIVGSTLSWFSCTSNAHGTNSWLLKNSSPCSLCPYIFSGSCPSEGRTWLWEPDVGWATSLCANTKSFMYWQMATPPTAPLVFQPV